MNHSDSRASFETTHWSMIQAAGDGDQSRCREAMQHLYGRYWFPLYAFARRRGYDSNQAQDLIQAFFLRVLEKDVLGKADRERGRFRNFLLASLKNYLANESAKATAIRRGGEHPSLSLDFRDAEGRLAHEAIDNLTPEAHYQRQWALEVLQRTIDQLGRDYQGEGKSELFEALRPYLGASSERLPYAVAAERLGMASDAVKVAVHRMRRRYRRRLENEISATVSSPAEIDEEIRELFMALRAPNQPL